MHKRTPSQAGFAPTLTGARYEAVIRRGKFLVLSVVAECGPVHVVFHLSGGQDLRYVDQKKMGQVFLTKQPPQQAPIAGFAGLGPEALDVSRENFTERLKPFRGETKGILTHGDFVAGTGNAYADEVLWAAQPNPCRKKTSLTAQEAGPAGSASVRRRTEPLAAYA